MSKIEIPKISENPEYKTEAAKLGAIRRRIADLRESLSAEQSKLSAIAMAKADRGIDNRAEEILQGKLEPIPANASAADIRAEVERLETELQALHRAAAKQKECVDTVVSKLSMEVGEKLLPAHKKAVAAMLDALEKVDVAAREADEIRREMERLGYSSPLPMFYTPPVRFPLQPQYRLDGFIADVRKYCE